MCVCDEYMLVHLSLFNTGIYPFLTQLFLGKIE